MNKRNRSIRFDAKVLEAAQALGLDVNELARKAIEQAVMTQVTRCPLCGSSLKKTKAKD